MNAPESVDEDADAEDVWHMRLYVAGASQKSARAISNLQRLCDVYLDNRYEIEVIDLAVNPELARNDDILAVPTLVRSLPAPLRKVIGDLSNIESVIVGLRLDSEQQ